MCWRPRSWASAVALAGAAQAQGLKQVGTIAIPGGPINSFGVMYIDPGSSLGYLADKDNKAVDIIDTRTDSYVGRIAGFAGTANGGASAGPNGIIAVNDGAELWVSDGDSTIKVIEPKSGKITGTIATGGKKRANAMAYDPKDHLVIVANPNDQPAFLTLVSTEPGHRIVAKIPVEDAAESLERSDYHAASGMFYTDVPILRADHTPRRAGADRSEDRQAGEAARDRPLPSAQPRAGRGHHHVPGLQPRAGARRRACGVRRRQRQGHGLSARPRQLGRHRGQSQARAILPVRQQRARRARRCGWSTSSRASWCRKSRPRTAPIRSASRLPTGTSICRPPPRTGPAAAASRSTRRNSARGTAGPAVLIFARRHRSPANESTSDFPS